VPRVPSAAWAKLFQTELLATGLSAKRIVVVVCLFAHEKNHFRFLLFSTFCHSFVPGISKTNSGHNLLETTQPIVAALIPTIFNITAF
jgi:hypothetical protein